jgi:hypothetical protein
VGTWREGCELLWDHLDTHWNAPDYWHGGIYGRLEIWEVDSHGHALKTTVQLEGVC